MTVHARSERVQDEFELQDHDQAQQLAIEHLMLRQDRHIAAVLAGGFVEMTVVVVFFIMAEATPECWSRPLNFSNYPIHFGFAVTFGLLGAMLLTITVMTVMASIDRSAELRRPSTWTSIVTALWMILVPALFDSSKCSSVLCPVFLRVWMAYRYFKTAIFSAKSVSKPVQAIGAQVLFMVTLVVTCVGFMQTARALEKEKPETFEANFYLTVVTLSTVGYGTMHPEGVFARVVAIFEIFIAMIMLPILTNDITEVINYFEAQRGYSESTKHLIIVGKLTVEEMLLIFREHLDNDHKFQAMQLVFISPVPFPSEITDIVGSHELKGKVTLTLGSPRNPAELARFAPRRADAVLFYSSSAAPAQRGDYNIILLSMLFRRHDSELPQYFMLKHSKHAHILHRSAFVIYDREALKYSLIGLSLRIGGFLSFFLNLMRPTQAGHDAVAASRMYVDPETDLVLDRHPRRRVASGSASDEPYHHDENTYEDEDDEDSETTDHFTGVGDWYRLYALGARQSLYIVGPPAELELRNFSSAALIMQLRVGCTLIGLVRGGRALLNPSRVKLHNQDKLVVIAESLTWLQDRLSRFSSLETADREGTQAVPVGGAVGKPHEDRSYDRSTVNCYPFREHVVIVDVSSARASFDMCSEEHVETDMFRADALLTMASHFPKSQSFVLVSLNSLTDDEANKWEADGRLPLFHLLGSPLDDELVGMSCPSDARAILIYSAAEGHDSSVLRSTRITVQQLFFKRLANRDTPVVVLTDDTEDFGLFEPRLNPALPPKYAESARNFDHHHTAYATSGVVSTTMLDALLLRTYFNEYLPQVVDQLLTPGVVVNDAVAEYMTGRAAALATGQTQPVGSAKRRTDGGMMFGQLCRILSGLERVPLGIARKVDDEYRSPRAHGRYCFATNPPATMDLRDTDRILYLAPDRRFK